MREVIVDVETTGKAYKDGHRVIQVAAVEIIDGAITGKNISFFVNPGRKSEPSAFLVHGIADHFLKDKPPFKEIMPKLLDFITGARFIAHNSDFDEKFINNEMKIARCPKTLWEYIDGVVDTLELSRKVDSKARGHSLNAVLDRYGIDRTSRDKHDALLDCELLAKAYLELNKKVELMPRNLNLDKPRKEIERLVLNQRPLALKISAIDLELNNDYFKIKNKP